MNYRLIMNEIIEQARGRVLECYTERHHIIPRCMGGTDDADNLVDLTAREHYIVHQLLVKIYPNNRKLIFAAHRMTSGRQGDRVNNTLYAWLRTLHAKEMSNLYTGKTYEERYGVERAAKIKAQRSVSLKGKPKSDAHKRALVESWAKREASDKARKAASISCYNLSQNKEARLKAAETKAANWLITDPQGNTIQIKNLRKYCRDNNLPFQSVHKGFKGWTSQKIIEKTRS